MSSTSLDIWERGDVLGTGTTGIVYRVKNKETGDEAAMKVVNAKNDMPLDEWEKLRVRTAREARILLLLDHPNIVKIYDSFELEGKWYLIMELVEGGELLDSVQDHPDGRLPENEARILFRQIVSAVEYCHSLMVVHRDLKLESRYFFFFFSIRW
jgi:serine/threonine protein kinase